MESLSKTKLSYLASKGRDEGGGGGDELSVELRKKRDEMARTIRSNFRNQEFFERRTKMMSKDNQLSGDQMYFESVSPFDSVAPPLRAYIEEVNAHTFTLADLPKCREALYSNDEMEIYYGLIGIRRILAADDNPPIQETLDENVLTKIMDYAYLDQKPLMQLQALWCLSNLASGNSIQCQFLVDKGVVPLFIKMLNSKNIDFIEQVKKSPKVSFNSPSYH